MFVYNSGRKSKTNIDYTVRDALRSNDDELVENTKKATSLLRKEYIAACTLKSDLKKFESLAFYYSIIDFYDLKKMALKNKYTREKDYNLEHFIMMNTNGVVWVSDDDDTSLSFPLSDDSFFKECKKYTVDYLIINEDLNQKMGSHDVVKKIEEIEEWYVSEPIPNHIMLYLKNIKALDSYKKLVELKKNNEKNMQIINEKYTLFLHEYFSEENRAKLEKSIWDSLKDVFK